MMRFAVFRFAIADTAVWWRLDKAAVPDYKPEADNLQQHLVSVYCTIVHFVERSQA